MHVCAGNFYQYAIAHFRLNLDFKRILVTNCLVSLTYILFALICADGIWWPMVLVAGECVGLVYVAAVTRFHQEGLQRTEMLGDTTKKMLTLMLTLLVLASAGAMAEEAANPASVLVDRINAPQVHADFAFAEDAALFEVIFPQILNCDAIFLRCGGETILVDSCKKAYSQRIVNMCKQLGITVPEN